MSIFTDIILAMYNVLFQNLGVTILALGIISRIIFIPSSISMIRYQKKLQEIKPKLDELKRKHKGDKKKQFEEQAKLFKEEGINQASGCLNAIVQIVIAFVLYNALMRILKMPDLNTHFLIWDLTKPDIHRNIISNIPLPGLLVILSAVSQLVLSKMMAPAKPIEESAKKIAKKEKVPKAEKQDFADAAAQMQSQMLFLFPAMILFFGYSLPAGLGLYWAITTLFGIVQQHLLVGWGGLADWLPGRKNKQQLTSDR